MTQDKKSLAKQGLGVRTAIQAGPGWITQLFDNPIGLSPYEDQKKDFDKPKDE